MGRLVNPSRMLWIMLIILTAVFGGCRQSATGLAVDPVEATAGTRKILVLPFRNLAALYGPYASVRSPLGNYVMMTGPVAPGADEFLTLRLVEMLRGVEHYSIIPPELVADLMTASMPEDGGTLSDPELVLKAGQAVNADLVLAGFVYRFEQRVGRDYSIQTPASVAFDMFGLQTSDGRIIRIGRFDETQQALTENLLTMGKFIKRKGKWITAEDMAVDGLENMLTSIP